jgi:DNA-binding HxlR family transcriptional regulator
MTKRSPWEAAADVHSRAFCPRFHHAVELIGRRWTGAIVRVLLQGPRRFSELAVSVPGLSERLLAQRLRELEAEGLVVRRVLPGPPVRVEYELTRAGHELEAVVTALADWAHHWGPSGEGGRGAC